MPTVSIQSQGEGEDEVYEINVNEVLFDALCNQGLQLPHGCLAGSCGACRVEIIEGEENLKSPSAVEQDTLDAIKLNYERIHGPGSVKGKIIRLSCRARVLGDIKIKKLR